MAERRKNRKRKDDIPEKASADKPSKEEFAVAKWIRENVPSKKTKFVSHNVEYFTGSRAVEALLENSPWKKNIFATREQVVDFLDNMLRHKFFHRARKVVVSEEELSKLRGLKKKGKDSCKDEKKLVDKENTEGEGKEDELKERETKKKPKVRLEMHMEQYFSDCNDAYVWIYEPIPVYYWFFGALVVLGAIGVCLFPLWPPTIRHGVYYLSVAAAGFFICIIALAILRLILFCVIWLFTLGRHHLWLLPNLAEDVGFLASFWPLYQYDYYGPGSERKSKKKKRKKDSDCEDTQGNHKESEVQEKIDTVGDSGQEEPKEEEVSGEDGSESEKSTTEKDFEILQHTELESK